MFLDLASIAIRDCIIIRILLRGWSSRAVHQPGRRRPDHALIFPTRQLFDNLTNDNADV
jgi:hypothetical protein